MLGHLVNVGRSAVRVEIATEQGFPMDHAEFAWKAVSGAVAKSEATELHQHLAMAEESPESHAQLVNYAWGGASQVRGEVKTLCKAAVALYGIPGDYSPTEITKHVKWLTGKCRIFKYGGVNLESQAYDVQQPYGAPFYKVVMSKQWFDSLKSEGMQALSFEQFIDSPVPILMLLTSGMENLLKDLRYEHHRTALLNLQSKSLTWSGQFQRNLYSKIVASSNFPQLKRIIAESDEDELDGVDFEALEASARNVTSDVSVPAPGLATAPVVEAATSS
ncbi:hypothetical protein FB451DRAFT_1559747 [Mycena latifolia]|nr:hypothetical protein FB451DRAFT_1559747 [Mycena latifolia]